MILHKQLSAKELRTLIKAHVITFGGNKKLKIFGKLNCASGKRMKMDNRVFFTSAEEAKYFGCRPCGHCMKQQYQIWKQQNGLI
ncbi:MAG: metal-binding protein [Flavobacterium psychrophilum]|nr:MAG: metal-binding protein [Flavobacterium psychrophilum]